MMKDGRAGRSGLTEQPILNELSAVSPFLFQILKKIIVIIGPDLAVLTNRNASPSLGDSWNPQRYRVLRQKNPVRLRREGVQPRPIDAN